MTDNSMNISNAPEQELDLDQLEQVSGGARYLPGSICSDSTAEDTKQFPDETPTPSPLIDESLFPNQFWKPTTNPDSVAPYENDDSILLRNHINQTK
jgi:hypothetical protein